MCDKGHIFVLSHEIFYCDRTNLTPSDKKLGRGANLGFVFLLTRNSDCAANGRKHLPPFDKKLGRGAWKGLFYEFLLVTMNFYGF